MKTNDLRFNKIQKEIFNISKSIEDIRKNIPQKVDGVKNILLEYSEQFVKKATSLEIWQARITGAIIAVSIASGISGIVLYLVFYFFQRNPGLTIL